MISIVLNNFVNDSRVLKEAISLENNGYEVKVVALYEENLKEFDIQSGVHVHRVKLKTRNLSKHFLFQIIKYVEFSIKVLQVYKKVDFIHVNDLGPLPLAVLMKILNKNINIVYDAHEYQTEVKGLGKFRKKIMKMTEKLLIKKTDSVITVSPSIANEYVKLYNISKPKLVLNCPNYRSVKRSDLFRERFNIGEEKRIFLYQGALASGRQIELLLESFSNLLETNAVLVIMGNGVLQELVKDYEKKYDNIFYHEAVNPEIVLDYTVSADIGFALLEDSCLNHSYALPNKFFEYIMAGLPVVTNNLPELGYMVQSNAVGWVLGDLTVNDLIKVVKKIVSDEEYMEYRKNTREMARNYCWEKQEKNLISAYSSDYK
ncbi:glycosyltransferase [Virgibacillus sp. MG-45]|uniref:glycosyltransferase n=1 Tax=Virgibacillus sp. MG-45 TaxID=3102791 RepID=UPI002EDB16B9